VVDDADFDPFKDDEADEAQTETPAGEADNNEETTTVATPDVEELPGGNGISVTFKAHGGYSAPWVTVRGTPEFLAETLGVEGVTKKPFTGKVSQIMRAVAAVDAFYKKEIGDDPGKG
jgi:hypothetical protein